MRDFVRTIQKAPLGFAVLAIILLGAAVAVASDSITVNYATNQNITAFSTCKSVTNNSSTGLSMYVPTVTEAEWSSFYTNPPSGVTAATCPAASGTWQFVGAGCVQTFSGASSVCPAVGSPCSPIGATCQVMSRPASCPYFFLRVYECR